MEIVLVVVVLAVAVAAIAAPLRAGRNGTPAPGESVARAELEAAKEAKLREIREAELDLRLGKLSREDWRALDAELRAEAIGILRGLDELGAAELDADRRQ